jgi:hypothetical protein
MRVSGFDIALVWHDRTTTYPIGRCLRERILAQVPDEAT